MKKLLVPVFILCALFWGVRVVHAFTLDDAFKEIESLKTEVAQLKASLTGSAAGSVLGVSTNPQTVASTCSNGATNPPYCTTLNLLTTTTTPTTDLTPRISYWSGKVNQHVDIVSKTWQTDIDGKSGASIDKLTYCRKFYPNTMSVSDYKNETINTWKDMLNTNDYISTKMSYKCNPLTKTQIINCPAGCTCTSTTAVCSVANFCAYNTGVTNYPSRGISALCSNGATNYPSCTTFVCANGASNYPTCSTYSMCSNGATNFPACTTTTLVCLNGMTNYPTCTASVCANGATNPPTCSTTTPVCLNGMTNYPACTLSIPGCTSSAGYSSTTGVSCSTGYFRGCTSNSGYSSVTGLSCAIK